MEAGFYTQKENSINGRKIWLYLISTPIGQFAIVEYEKQGLEVTRKIFDEDYEKAEKYFDNVCRRIIGGKL